MRMQIAALRHKGIELSRLEAVSNSRRRLPATKDCVSAVVRASRWIRNEQ